MVALIDVDAPLVSNGRDSFLWRNASGMFCPSFSSKETWEQLRIHSPIVPWTDVVWFKEHVPRFSFITWLALLARLPTRDRLRGWGMNIPADCVLCSNGVESHEHLFFDCSYASEIWGYLAAKLLPNPPSTISAASSWILLHRLPHHAKVTAILKLLLQSVVYHLWKERNSRIFAASATSSSALRLAIDRSMRNRLLSFPGHSLLSSSLLQFYFSRLSFPL
ncbi:Reverse transcriptase zinc-binding domain [Arabidopsis thaliana x Arabidopsis arenosa]|uniref:Reverse transcriptase zinc-binding domain n=1 Tax=Arabidopsis thaliana x Arabidopsis arenosa TaxID=1240361 RepID=A0A8T1YUU3_9BRAS|nr:Reverse transcriptase zinc-binding domain [Arabidopsis thaliana x Arabidopsis arenosa]